MAQTISPKGRVAVLSDEQALEDALNNDLVLPSLFKISAKGAKFNVFGIDGVITAPEVADALARYSGLTQTEIDAITVFVTAEVANGNWGTKATSYADSLYDFFYLFALGTAAQALTDMHQVLKLTAINNGATKVADGFSFDGIDDWVDSAFNPNSIGVNYTQNDAQFGVFNKTAVSTQNTVLFGAQDGTPVITRLTQQPTNSRLQNNMNAGGQSNNSFESSFANDSLYNLVRTASTGAGATSIIKNGVANDDGSTDSNGTPNLNIAIGARDNTGTRTNFINATFSLAQAGAAIGFDQTGYNTNVVTLLTSLGVLP